MISIINCIVADAKCSFFLQGLKHLHDNQMIHMDIKPANVLIGLDGLYKIADFGLVLDISKVRNNFCVCISCKPNTF